MRIFKSRTALWSVPALMLPLWVPASLGADFWDITGNNNTTDANFLGTKTGYNFDLVFRTDGFERARILKRKAPTYSDLDGLFQITTNLRLFDPFDPTFYSGDLIMPKGRWHGFSWADTTKAGNLDMDEGNLSVKLGDLSVTNADGLMFSTFENDLILDMADLRVKLGNLYIGPTNLPMFFAPVDTNNLVITKGRIIIGYEDGPVFPPPGKAAFRIDAIGRAPKFGQESNHVLHIKSHDNPNDPNDTPDGIAIELANVSNNGFTNAKSNFITFYNGYAEPVGRIEGNLEFGDPVGGHTGVALVSQGADFAEFLEKLNPEDTFGVGEIVGVFAGKISRQTEGADHILVITGAPIVVGNAPPAHLENLYARVAFLGQVPILVSGAVQPGDYILPSGLEDGIGIAVSPADIQPEDLSLIIGTAWSDSAGGDVPVFATTALGLKAINWGQIIETKVPKNDEFLALKEQVDKLERMLDRLTGRQPAGGNF